MNKLRVPENIPLRWELMRGFGRPELLRSIVVVGIVLICSIAFSVFSSLEQRQLISVAAVIVSIFFCAFFFGRLENQSIYEYLVRQRRFRSEQQTFIYKRKSEVLYFEKEQSKR